MLRPLAVCGCGLVGVSLAALVPWAAIPLLLWGLFMGGLLVDRPTDDRGSRQAVAHRVGLLVGMAAAALWFVGGPPEPAGTVRVGLAVALGLGAGLAGLAATIVGMDARRSSPQERL